MILFAIPNSKRKNNKQELSEECKRNQLIKAVSRLANITLLLKDEANGKPMETNGNKCETKYM